MNDIEFNRKLLNKNQTVLRNCLTSPIIQIDAVEMLLDHHASLHSAEVSDKNNWSFEDAILNDIDETIFRRIPKNCEHSIAWCIWHLARIEDITMNLLVSGDEQILIEENWQERLRIKPGHSGNGMHPKDIQALSDGIDLEGLKGYRLAIGRKTQAIIKRLDLEKYKEKVLISRIHKVIEEGAVIESASAITDYWSKRTINGLFLMPATRHNIVHLNEALQLKRRSK